MFSVIANDGSLQQRFSQPTKKGFFRKIYDRMFPYETVLSPNIIEHQEHFVIFSSVEDIIGEMVFSGETRLVRGTTITQEMSADDKLENCLKQWKVDGFKFKRVSGDTDDIILYSDLYEVEIKTSKTIYQWHPTKPYNKVRRLKDA